MLWIVLQLNLVGKYTPFANKHPLVPDESVSVSSVPDYSDAAEI